MTQTKPTLEIIMTRLWFLIGIVVFVFMMLQEATYYYGIFGDSELIRTEEALSKIM